MEKSDRFVGVVRPVADVGKAEQAEMPVLFRGQSCSVAETEDGLWDVADDPPVVGRVEVGQPVALALVEEVSDGLRVAGQLGRRIQRQGDR